MKSTYLLVDSNCFYVSCERIFRPDLWFKPVVVLSNNDGCIIARSNEVKQLGVEMGAPIFKLPKNIRNQLHVFSANFRLYGDISARVVSVLKQFHFDVEIYSIDECFLHGQSADISVYKEIRKRVWRYVGIPVSVGAAPTKTLAKLTTLYAKKHKTGVAIWDDLPQFSYLSSLDVDRLWGISKGFKKRLNQIGIFNCHQMKQGNPAFIKQKLNVNAKKTVLELNEIPCTWPDESPKDKKQIIRARSFGKGVRTFEELKESVCHFTGLAAKSLREQNLITSKIGVFLMTNPFKNEPQYRNYSEIDLAYPSADNVLLMKTASRLLKSIYRENYCYKKSGVVFLKISNIAYSQLTFWGNDDEKRTQLLNSIDRFNSKNLSKITFASEGLHKSWKMNQNHLSPNYTSDWSQLRSVSTD